MKKLILLFVALTVTISSQTVSFDDAGSWIASSGGGLTSYQTDHQYNTSVSGFTVKFTGGPALRETATQDSFPRTYNSSTYAWRLRDNSTVEWSATILATSIDGFSFYVRRWDGSPSPNFDVSFSVNGGTDWTSIGTIDNTFLNNSSDWKQFLYSTTISATDSIIIRIKANGTTERIIVDEFNFSNPLPVELTSFTSNILSNGVELKWQTSTEVNNYGFEILRSAQNDNINDNWTTLGFVNGNGNSNSPKDYSFVDEDIKNQQNGKYYYRLKQIDTDGSYEYSEEIEVNWTNGITDVNDESNLPKEFSLSQNYPNPFNPTTKIKYTIPSFVETHNNVFQQNGISVKLKIYNVMGQEIATLVNEIKTPGEYEVEFNGKGLSSGMYFYKIEAGNFVQVKKMIMMK